METAQEKKRKRKLEDPEYHEAMTHTYRESGHLKHTLNTEFVL